MDDFEDEDYGDEQEIENDPRPGDDPKPEDDARLQARKEPQFDDFEDEDYGDEEEERREEEQIESKPDMPESDHEWNPDLDKTDKSKSKSDDL